MIVLGIDPGLNGGVAVVGGSLGRLARIIDAMDVPTVGVDAKKRVDAPHLLDWIQRHAPDLGIIERAQAFPGQGGSSSFIYGRAVGYLECCMSGLGIPIKVIESGAWKKFHGLSGRDKAGNKLEKIDVKENSRQLAIALFPGNHIYFERKRDHNRAEAALIASYGLAKALAEVHPHG